MIGTVLLYLLVVFMTQGYRVFIAIAMILGDGLYHVFFMPFQTFYSLAKQKFSNEKLKMLIHHSKLLTTMLNGELINFLKDQIPKWVAMVGYVVLAAIPVITVPLIFHKLKWYGILAH